MAITYLLNATACPPLVAPGGYLIPGTDAPVTADSFASVTHALEVKPLLEANAVRQDLLGRYGGGGIALGGGLGLSAGAGLTLNIAEGMALIDGPVHVPATTLALTNGTNRIWISQTGVPLSPRLDLTTPSGLALFIGTIVASGGAIGADVDLSGVLFMKGGYLIRRTADAGTPGDTPPATLAFLTKTAGGLYFWDGWAYAQIG
jgi:hypothetical protein